MRPRPGRGVDDIDYLFYVTDIEPRYYAAAAIGAVLLFCCLKRINLRGRAAAALLFPYLFLVLASTVFDRAPGEQRMVLEPFYSYKVLLKRDARFSFYLAESCLNILMLMPVGFLLPELLKSLYRSVRSGQIELKYYRDVMRERWRRISKRRRGLRPYLFAATVCGGLLVSVVIEMLQYVSGRGLLEVDDIINNTLGVLLGYLAFFLMEALARVLARRR